MSPWRGLLLAIFLGTVCWLVLAWSIAHKGDVVGVTTVDAAPSQEHAAQVRVAEVTNLWLTLHEQVVVDEFLREHAEQERQKARRAVEKARAARLAAASAPTPGGIDWDAIARCESGGRWNLNTGNGYFGGLQFSLGTWRAAGGAGYPHHHPRAVQIAIAENLLRIDGRSSLRHHWPICGRHA